MRLKKLACGLAVFGMTAGSALVMASAAHADNIYPYIDWSNGANTGSTTLIGSTDPGQADGNLCLTFPDSGSTGSNPIISLSTAGHYSGRVNGTVTNPATQLDEDDVLQDLTTTTPTCTASSITYTASQSGVETDFTKHIGVLSLTTTADVQAGIEASSFTNIRVHCTTGQVVATPSGSTILATSAATAAGSKVTCNSGSSTIDVRLKAVAIKVKASLNTAACDDSDNVVNLGIADDDNGNRTVVLDNSANDANGASHHYAPADALTKNLITIRECAENTGNVPGKPLITKITITGAGTDSIDSLYAQTAGPKLWDTTRGKTCADAKVTVTNTGTVNNVSVPLTQGARIMKCSGDYGVKIPFVISVRGIDPSNATIDPKGLLHPEPPAPASGSAFTIT